jgi:hypothetical protein
MSISPTYFPPFFVLKIDCFGEWSMVFSEWRKDLVNFRQNVGEIERRIFCQTLCAGIILLVEKFW